MTYATKWSGESRWYGIVDEMSYGHVHDIPLPIPFDARSWRCKTCGNLNDHSRVWKVQLEDMKRAFPGVLVHKVRKADARKQEIFMTPAFLEHLVRSFYESMNARDVRRRLTMLYMDNALALARRHDRTGMGPWSLAWYLESVPANPQLRSILLRALGSFITSRVQLVRQRVCVFSGQVVRHDGNWDLAQRVLEKNGGKWVRPYTVLHAFSGVDGCLLDVPIAMKTEAWEDIAKALSDLLQTLKSSRLMAGLSLEQSCPVAHCTDNYFKHRLLLQKLYAETWSALRIQAVAATPKGHMKGLTAAARADCSCPCIIAGDPFHDSINLRKC